MYLLCFDSLFYIFRVTILPSFQGLQMQSSLLANSGSLYIYVLLMCIVPIK